MQSAELLVDIKAFIVELHKSRFVNKAEIKEKTLHFFVKRRFVLIFYDFSYVDEFFKGNKIDKSTKGECAANQFGQPAHSPHFPYCIFRQSVILCKRTRWQGVCFLLYIMNNNNPLLTARAQTLRKNMTKEERKLWYDFLKSLPLTFNRQKVMGNYIVDFFCAQKKLCIELDGSQHYESAGVEYDARRDEYLRGLGLTVLRYSNLDVNQRFSLVCEDIMRHIGMQDDKSN